MNKYQDALNAIKKDIEYIKENRILDYISNYFESSIDEVKVIQELVDKETPIKVLKNTNYINCPACYMPLVDYDKDDITSIYCKYCGQKLDRRK